MIACAAKGISRIQPSRSSGCPLVWTEKDLRRLGEGRSGRGGPQRGAKGHRRRPLDFAPGNPRRQNRKSKVSKSEIPGVRYFFRLWSQTRAGTRMARWASGRREFPGVDAGNPLASNFFYGVGRGDFFYGSRSNTCEGVEDPHTRFATQPRPCAERWLQPRRAIRRV